MPRTVCSLVVRCQQRADERRIDYQSKGLKTQPGKAAKAVIGHSLGMTAVSFAPIGVSSVGRAALTSMIFNVGSAVV